MPEYSEEQIRDYAYRLWEKAGSTHGNPEDFWHQARSELESDAPGDDTPGPMPE